jgi:hypothetical protein
MNRFAQFLLVALALSWPARGQPIEQRESHRHGRLIAVAAPQDQDDQARRDRDKDDRGRDRADRRHDRDDRRRDRDDRRGVDRDRDRDEDRHRVYQDRDRDRDHDNDAYDRDDRAYRRGGYYGPNREWRGRLSAEDQRRFDSYYSRWLGYRKSNNQSEAASMDRRMRDLYAHYSIPNNVPFNQVASPGIGPTVAY